MHLQTSAALSMIIIVATPMMIQADTDYTVPPVCQQATASTVALVDCLQTQHEILKHVIEYESLVLQADVSHRQRRDNEPPHPDQQTSSSSADNAGEPAMERVAWFDQNLEIYAIVGDGDSRTAHARMSGREYRLRIGDQVRLATVVLIEPRTVHLEIPGIEFKLGLSGSATVLPQNGNP